jgi:PIN domain nuclease of toxin-antitoxin system
MRGAALPPALLLDTCAVIWFVNLEPLGSAAIEAIEHASTASGVFISPLGKSVSSRGREPGAKRLQFLPDPEAWFAQLMASPGVRMAALTPDIAIAASLLPGELQRDPGDRFIIATARQLGIPIVTRDRRIAGYSTQGHVQMIPC